MRVGTCRRCLIPRPLWARCSRYCTISDCFSVPTMGLTSVSIFGTNHMDGGGRGTEANSIATVLFDDFGFFEDEFIHASVVMEGKG